MFISPENSARLRVLHVDIPSGQHNFSTELLVYGPSHFGGGVHTRSIRSLGAFSYSVSPISGSLAQVGRYCSFGSGIVFAEMEHPTEWLSTSSFTYDRGFIWGPYTAANKSVYAPFHLPFEQKRGGIVVGNDVWIGARSYIRGGATIGDGAIIGAHAVVTKDVPPYAIVVGNPGRVVKYRFPQLIVERLLKAAWWRFDYTALGGLDFTDAERGLELLEHRIEGGLKPCAPPAIRLADYADPDG